MHPPLLFIGLVRVRHRVRGAATYLFISPTVFQCGGLADKLRPILLPGRPRNGLCCSSRLDIVFDVTEAGLIEIGVSLLSYFPFASFSKRPTCQKSHRVILSLTA